MSDKTRKTNGLELPNFDPKESAVFATQVLDNLNIKSVLIGRLAVWYWLPDPAGHAYTKDLDTAIKKADRQKIIKHLSNLKYDIRELMIGGVNVHSAIDKINVDFIDRYSINEGDLSSLFEEAIEWATERINIKGTELYVISPEHLIAMKIATFERKDEDDAKNLLEYDFVDIKKLRGIIDRNIAPVRVKLEQLLREVGHPMAHRRQKYY
ncbi:MAG: nucleotidyltransferase [Desulfamplus sp.]|nr:nucleotidyltransferase [Desulfamplus sp.]